MHGASARAEYHALGMYRRNRGSRGQAPRPRNRAANIKYMAGKTIKPERLEALATGLAAVEAERRRLRRYNEVVSFALDEELARRAGLAAAGKPA